MTSAAEPNPYLAKITKLLAKAEDPACTPAEAEAFNDKAAKLMAQFMISDADIQAHRTSADPEEKIVTVVIEPDVESSMRLSWELVNMGAQVAPAMNCKGFIRSVNKHRQPYRKALVLVGYQSDVNRVIFLWNSLQRQVIKPREIALKDADTYSYAPLSRQEKDTFRNSFIRGFGSRVAVRLTAMRREAVAEASTGTDLVLVARSSRVDSWIEENMLIGKARKRTTSAQGDHAGWKAGAHASLASGELDDTTSAKALGN